MEFRDLKKQYIRYKNEIDKAIFEVLNSSNFISGPEVELLETKLAKFVGIKHCISCANGTDALSLVLSAWNIKKGDAVFVPDFTFFSTAEVVAYSGATPIFVDVNIDTYNIDVIHLEKKILEVINEKKLNPKVIIPVDLFGLLSDYDSIYKIASKYNLKILEDAAQGFGAKYKNKNAGSFGSAAITSFFPAKPLGCYGDGGAIFTDDDDLSRIVKSLRVHGKGTDKYDNIRIGQNSRLDTIQAAILNVKLEAFITHELNDVNLKSKIYTNELIGYVKTPLIPQDYLSCYAQYTIQLKSKYERDNLQEYLRSNNIPTFIYYKKPLHSQIAFEYLKAADLDYPVSTKLCQTVLSIPIHPYLTDDEQNYIISIIKKYFEQTGEFYENSSH